MANRLNITVIEDKTKEMLETLNQETFFYDFLALYQFPKATLTRLRKENGNHVKNKALFEVLKSGQSVVARVAEIEKEFLSKRSKPRFIIVTDFKELAAKDTKTGDSLSISFSELPAYVEFFLPWNGIEKVDYAKENPADIKAAERFTRLYDELRKINQFDDQTTEEKEFNLFLIRLLFLLFAEDTEIMKKGIFTNAIKTRSYEDGSDLNNLFNQIFASLDVENRESQVRWLQDFPYVNGKLFTKAHTNLRFDRKTRKLILEAGELLNWNDINPDILGAMIQTVANKEHRSSAGMHYTSVENILKVIKPLFLDDLEKAYETIATKINDNEDKDITDLTRQSNRRDYLKELEDLHDRIGAIKFLDPACGSGNFLIITYKEIRRLEIKLLKTMRELRQDGTIDFFETSKISLNHFYGIELDDFAHEVARLSLWIAEYQMNLEAEKEINLQAAFLPLRDAGNITQGNALRLDWNEVLPHTTDDEIYIIGNPPYIGSRLQSKEQKEDLRLSIGEEYQYRRMDYIAAWFFKGIHFIQGLHAKLAFVSTNSLFQGEQVAIVWESLLNIAEIEFAYTSFKWGNSAAHNAGVTVAIVGISNKTHSENKKLIFTETQERMEADLISPYLTKAKETVLVRSKRQPISDLPAMVFGSMPRDGGYLLIENKQKYLEIIDRNPELKSFIKQYVGSEEFINNKVRYCFWLNECQYQQVKDNSIIQQRVSNVRNSRLASSALSTQLAAEYPYAFVQKGEWEKAYQDYLNSDETEFLQIIVPAVSSENRDYVPMGFVGEETIVSNATYVIYNAPIYLLGLLQSHLHMVWLRAIGGKLETRYRYSAGLVYNTFPVPDLSTHRKNRIEDKVWEILDLREELGGTLADLYHRDTMPEVLRQAHQELDELVEKAYKETPFRNDEERLSHLLKRYKEMTDE
ncbi:class I SAM-dependent DNA methyltransferase [Streptococcus halotolerans]|uniref:class I SAM-dependent DNA methyltransferase n=1 Tax=Streptococcus halotolerans TaxID=1814128 RepID=UPI000788674F|nr:DNA methyltransferase [Streptococcus halotolerans]